MEYTIKNVISSSKVPAWGNKKQYIGIHYLGVDGQNHDLSSDGCGAHYYIYWDGTIYQRCSHDAVPWAVGTAGYYTKVHPLANNYNTISIEMCCHCDGNSKDAEDKKWYFTEETQKACVWLVQKLMKELNIPIENVLRHRDIVSKTCPAPYVHNNKYKTSWTWDEFKAKVSGTEIKSEPLYRVRKSWDDNKSQVFAGTLEGAKKNCPEGYSVFDENGNVVYKNEIKEITQSGNTDKIWMGWTKRETGSAGLRCIHGDAGKAYGLQFDYRYGLVPFMKYCVQYNSDRYSGFNTYISLGSGNSKLIYNSGLGKLWQKYYDIYTTEFEQLQYTCAYQQYYLPSKNYILSHYGFDIGNCHPSVKGTLWSMSFRSGMETAAKKFSSCKGKSDEAILNTVYPTYSNNDGGRWTKTGQWGDALNALNNNTYSIVNISMDEKSSSTPFTPTTPTSNTPYRVAVSYSNEKYINQVGAYTNLDNAKKKADDYGFKVFDENGNVVYTAKPLTIPELAVKWAIDTANDNSHGYDNTKGSRGGTPDYACSSFVGAAYKFAGVDLPAPETIYTASMNKIFTPKGFKKITSGINFKTGKGLELGDIPVAPGKHTEIYVGNGKLAGARGNANSGKPENGKAGDQSGSEIAVSAYWNYPWSFVLRYVGNNSTSDTTSTTYIVQAGSFTVKANAEALAKKLKSKEFNAIVKTSGSNYIVQCGSFSVKENAEALKDKLIAAGFTAIIK